MEERNDRDKREPFTRMAESASYAAAAKQSGRWVECNPVDVKGLSCLLQCKPESGLHTGLGASGQKRGMRLLQWYIYDGNIFILFFKWYIIQYFLDDTISSNYSSESSSVCLHESSHITIHA